MSSTPKPGDVIEIDMTSEVQCLANTACCLFALLSAWRQHELPTRRSETMPRKAEVVKARPRAGTIIAWAAWLPSAWLPSAWLPSIAGLTDLMRAPFISSLTAGMVYPWRFTNLNPLTESCSRAALPSFLFQTQTGKVTVKAKLKAQRILYAVRSGAAPESDGELYQAGRASRCAQSQRRIRTLR